MLRIGNCSSRSQLRWGTGVLRDASALPPLSFVAGALVAKGLTRPCGTNVHVLGHLDGFQTLNLTGTPLPVEMTPAVSRLLPDPAKLGLRLVIGGDSSALFTVTKIVADGPWRTQIAMRAVCRGRVAHLFASIYPWQDVIDLCGRVTWSDPANPLPKTDWEHTVIACDLGSISYDYRWFRAATPYDYDAFSVPFYGVWVPPGLDDGTAPPSDDELGGLWEQRVSWAMAATEGPVMASDLLAPAPIQLVSMQPDAYEDEFRAFAAGRGDYQVQSQRKFASLLEVGSTGQQDPFGFAKDMTFYATRDPRRLWQLRESTVDYLLRNHHHFEADGSAVTAAKHPGWRTWSTITHRTGSDLLGKATEGLGSVLGRTGVDDQHRGDAFIDCVRRHTYDPLLDMDLQERTEVDLARAKAHTHSLDAPRAGGRLLQSWAMAWHTAHDDDTRAKLERLSRDELELRFTQFDNGLGQVPRSSITGPVRPANVIAQDSRVLDGGPAIVPWNDCCLIAGLLHQWKLWNGRDQVLADRIMALMLELATTILRYAVVKDAAGTLYPLNGVLWLPNGEANPPSYYTFPRAGASFGDDAYDMLVGTRGWFGAMGWPTMAMVYLKWGQDQELREVALEVAVLAQQGSIATREWIPVL